MSGPSGELGGAVRHLINLTYLVRLRWVAVAGQVLTTLAAMTFLDLPLPGQTLGLVIGLVLLSNVGLWVWTRRGRSAADIREWTVAGVMALDVVLLTALLMATGGADNPFSSLYFVHVTLSAAVLRPVWTASLVVLSLMCFGLLYAAPWPSSWETELGAARLATTLQRHPEGKWIAFTLAAAVAAYFISRVQQALYDSERELAETRAREARSEKLASLATLSAGAAHELSTPLSTIALVAKELERHCARGRPLTEIVEDAQLIREQVDRCRSILTQMAAEAGHSLGELAERITLAALVERSVERLPLGHAQVAFQPPPELAGLLVEVPPNATAQALRGVIKNALDASPDGVGVAISLVRADGVVEIRVRDQGSGMPTEVLTRVGEPFFTTKEPGQGMGLGVFLARAVADRNGGALRFASVPGQGTEATMTLPLLSERARHAEGPARPLTAAPRPSAT